MIALLSFLPPMMWFLTASLLLALLPVRIFRLAVILAAPLLTLVHANLLTGEKPLLIRFIRYDLLPATVHPYSYMFAVAFALVALAGGLYAYSSRLPRIHVALGYLSAAAGVGILYAGDVLTLFFFWELLTICSLFLIWQGKGKNAAGAGLRYALVHILGGMLLLGGIIIHVAATDSVLLTSFHLNWDRLLWTSATYTQNIQASSLAIWLLFAGIAINAGAPPLSSWIADAYPEATPEGMVFLSTFTTKSAIFLLLTFFQGTAILIYLGVFMVVNGILMAMLESHIRRILAYALLVQLGILLITIGSPSPLSEYATAIHSFNHMFYNALLVIVAGVVTQRTGKDSLVDLGGLNRSMRFTCLCAVIGVYSLAGFPFTGGYIGKALVSSSVAAAGNAWPWYVITSASALAMLYAGWRFLWFVFFQPPPTPALQPTRMSFLTSLVLLGLLLCVLLPGMLPQLLLVKSAQEGIPSHFYNMKHIITQLQVIILSSLAFFFFLPLLRPTRTITLDLDWFYRCLLVKLVFGLEKLLGLGYTIFMYGHRRLMQFLTAFIIRLTGPGGLFAETRTLANTTLIVAVLLAGYLLLYHYQS